MNCLESTSVSELPAHIMFDIFSRLPPNTIGCCRCVCKTWCNLLLDPHFVNLHLSKSPSCLMINEYKGQQSTIFKLFEIDDELDHHHVHREPAITLQHGVAEKLYLQGSIDGLLCLWQFVIDDTYIFNPILREYVLLPKHKHVRKSQANVSYGFGFNPSTRQYKVVRVFQGNVPCDPPSGSSTYVSECEVYTLGTNTWRSVGHVPFSIGVRGVFVNGGFHGLSTDIPEMIARLDLEAESFQTVCSTPPPLNRDALYLISLVELGGCLCICDNSSDSELVIWVMKEYGVEESWTKEIVISRNYIPDWVGYEAVCPFKILKDGSILMLWRDDRLITYCPRTKAFEELDIGMSNYDTIYEAENYVPSIISLKNIILEKVQVF